ncbi:mitochondrial carrier [Coccomyxa subellipsoidea C-169]|uniref:Mitochondrial carrier n=1 Tax=Coccomyxa subellipsoidea (strain C-169) TaxID=574566 RepID=I0Z5I6_COCSC|nr:mitochondrial carrier [Coccomyxa subellipsoidea C-169]EIE25905.1 mitochondrial carrier [Coccomyxa subellipsoidea C-169]|eukprot:XP_005650449.1 mitochondrial carrier [Coccomyxa subellipsoidea C-169]
MSNSEHSWKHAVAGCTAGLVSVLALHPLDVVKTRLQVQDGVAGVLPVYYGTRDALFRIVQDEGWRALYAGISPALLGAGLSWGIYFTAYNNAKMRWQGLRNEASLSAPLHLLSAAEAGCIVCLLTNPIWVIKTRLQLQRRAARLSNPYRGFGHAVRQIAKEEGFAGFYRGLLPSLLLVSHGAIQFMVYEELKKAASGPLMRDNDSKQPLNSLEISVIGAVSKLAASIVTYPSQVVRARIQQRQDQFRGVRYDSGLRTLQVTMRREGVRGLYKGLLPNVLRVMPQSAITFLIYEKVMQLLDNQIQWPA